MKKIILLLVVVTALAFAAEVEVWWDNGSGWILQEGKTARCRKFVAGTAISELDTTMKVNPIALKNVADVGQWIKYSFTEGDSIIHFVRRPGTFAGIAPTLSFESNGNVTTTFSGFANLTKSGADDIVMSYALDSTNTWDDPADVGQWLTTAELNAFSTTNTTKTYTFWQKIVVPNMGKPGVYKDDGGATITLTLSEQATWIDSDGNFTFTK